MRDPAAAVAQATQQEQARALSDEEIVRQVRAGEVALYAILMQRYNQRLYRVVRAILRDEHEIEDILQETYLAAYRNLATFDRRARFSTWLVRITVNKALDRRRQRAKVVALDPRKHDAESNSTGSEQDPERESARRELAHLLEHAIDALPEAFRRVYVLREVDGMSTKETAESLGLELNTVKTRLHRARALLREQLVSDFDAATLQVFPFGGHRCARLVATVLAQLRSSAA